MELYKLIHLMPSKQKIKVKYRDTIIAYNGTVEWFEKNLRKQKEIMYNEVLIVLSQGDEIEIIIEE